MKKALIVFVVAILLLVFSGIWILGKSEKPDTQDILALVLVLIVVGFSVFVAVRKLASLRRGEPHEDELSKKIMRRTSSVSYYISLYMWLIIMYLSDKMKFDTHVIIGAGIMIMAVIFGLCWLYFNFTGIKNE